VLSAGITWERSNAMPEFGSLLLLILFFGVSFLRKKMKQGETKVSNQSKPQTYQPFAGAASPEAVSAMPKQPVLAVKPVSRASGMFTDQDMANADELEAWRKTPGKQDVPLAQPAAEPALPKRPVPAVKPKSRASGMFTDSDMANADELEAWRKTQGKQDTPLAQPAKLQKPHNRILLVFSEDSLIQGIVMSEILMGPRHAMFPRYTDYPPRN
jgi:hypothetical protein